MEKRKKSGLIQKDGLIIALGSMVFSPGMVFAQNIQTPIPEIGKDNPNILWVLLEDTNPWMRYLVKSLPG